MESTMKINNAVANGFCYGVATEIGVMIVRKIARSFGILPKDPNTQKGISKSGDAQSMKGKVIISKTEYNILKENTNNYVTATTILDEYIVAVNELFEEYSLCETSTTSEIGKRVCVGIMNILKSYKSKIDNDVDNTNIVDLVENMVCELNKVIKQ